MSDKKTVVILSSAILNNQDELQEYSCKIKKFLKNNIPKNYLLSIGIIKNRQLINYLHDNGYEINEINQHPNSLKNSNKKLIRNNDLVIFFNYPNSPYIDKYIQYAKENSKDIKILNLDEMDSATQLFSYKCNKFNHSESKWSAFAQMAFIWMGNQEKYLNIFKSYYNSQPNNWLMKSEKLDFKNWKPENSIVEGRISDLFPKEFNILNSKPDLVLIDKKDKKNTNILIIEVKTLKAKIEERQLKDYKKVVQQINKRDGYSCKHYYLISYGHYQDENNSNWKLLEKEEINIILWEELFLKMKNDKCPLLDYITPLGNINNWQEYINYNFR